MITLLQPQIGILPQTGSWYNLQKLQVIIWTPICEDCPLRVPSVFVLQFVFFISCINNLWRPQPGPTIVFCFIFLGHTMMDVECREMYPGLTHLKYILFQITSCRHSAICCFRSLTRGRVCNRSGRRQVFPGLKFERNVVKYLWQRHCRACAASDMGLSASVPLPIVMGIFVLLGFQSS